MAFGDFASDTCAIDPMMLLTMTMRFNLLLATQGKRSSTTLTGANTLTFMIFSHSSWRANMPPITDV
jgi:hypothetical protein